MKIITTMLFFVSFFFTKAQIKYTTFDNVQMESAKEMQGEANDYYNRLLERYMHMGCDAKFGFLNKDGTVFIGSEFDYATDFNKGKANIVVNGTPGLLFKNGTRKMFPEFDQTFWLDDNLGLAVKNKKRGFIDQKGKIVIPLIYDNAVPFQNGLAAVKKDGKWLYIKPNDEMVFDGLMKFTYKPSVDNNLIFIGEKKIEGKRKSLNYFNTSMLGFFGLKNDKDFKEGLINKKGKVILEAKYDEITGFYRKGLMIARNNDKYGLINKKGKIIIPFEYDYIKRVNNNLYSIEQNKKWGLINKKNKIIFPFEYNIPINFHEGLARVFINEKIGYMNKRGEIVIKPEYDTHLLGSFSNGLAAVKKDKKFGFINKKGKLVIPFAYDKVIPFEKGKTIVRKGNKEFYLNKDGEVINFLIVEHIWKPKDGLIRFSN